MANSTSSQRRKQIGVAEGARLSALRGAIYGTPEGMILITAFVTMRAERVGLHMLQGPQKGPRTVCAAARRHVSFRGMTGRKKLCKSRHAIMDVAWHHDLRG